MYWQTFWKRVFAISNFYLKKNTKKYKKKYRKTVKCQYFTNKEKIQKSLFQKFCLVSCASFKTKTSLNDLLVLALFKRENLKKVKFNQPWEVSLNNYGAWHNLEICGNSSATWYIHCEICISYGTSAMTVLFCIPVCKQNDRTPLNLFFLFNLSWNI